MRKAFLIFTGVTALVALTFLLGKNYISKAKTREVVSFVKRTFHSVAPKVVVFVKDIPSRFDHFKKNANQVNRYESMSFRLLQENRQLRVKMRQLSSKVSELKTQNKFFASQYDGYQSKHIQRLPSSVKSPVDSKNDMVKFKTYRWKDKKLLQVARKEWNRKNYVKSAQYYYTLVQNYPRSSLVNDRVFYETAMASLEAEIYDEWAEYSLEKLIQKYPRSPHYREAKLWMALVSFKQGDKEKFYETLDEFQLKYRNTPEWRVVKGYYKYEKISDRL